MLRVPIATVLRSLFVIYGLYGFFARYSDVFLLDPDQLHFPLPGLELFSAPFALFALACLAIGAGVLSILKTENCWAILVTGIAGFAFLLLTTEGRFAFSYFVPLGLIAIGIQSFYRSNARPVFVFLGMVYLLAALHKIANFSDMAKYLPIAAQQLFVAEISSRPEVSLRLGQLLAWFVVPVELIMGSLFFFQRTRFCGFLLACVFHLLLSVVSSERATLVTVSFSILLVHAIAAVSETKYLLRDFFPRRQMRYWLVAVACIAVCFIAKIGILLPLIALGAAGHFAQHRESEQRVFMNSGPRRFGLAVLIAILILWGLTPKLTGDKNDHLGFAMFSFASRKQPFFCIEISRPSADINCPPAVWRLPVIIQRRLENSSMQFCSRQPASIERFRVWSNQRCKLEIGSASLSTISEDQNFLLQL
jgi:hypothetical protein